MKKFTGIYEEFKEDLIRNKIENKTELIINITCDFCNLQEEYKCQNNVANKEERWLAVETFIQNGWDELIVPKDQGIACPVCVEKWNEGNWYVKENVDNDIDMEDFDEEENSFHLKSIKKTTFHVDWDDFDKLVNDYYQPPTRYKFVDDFESANDTTHELSASKGINDKWEKDDIKKFKENGQYGWLAPAILNDLCDDGIVEDGDYFIRASW